jgi:purine nucleosidase
MVYLCRKFNKEIIGITCVDGNAEISDVVTNTLITLQQCDAKINVYRGAKCNIQGYTAKDHYFGKDGFNGRQGKYDTALGPEYRSLVQPQSAFIFLTEAAEKYGKDLAIIASGPLTNIAIAYLLNNNFPDLIGGFVVMGGSYSAVGLNHIFSAEFNFHGDVDAAYLVIRNFKNIIIIPFEIALEAPLTNFELLFASDKTPKSLFIKDIFEGKFQCLCDPLCGFPLLMPETVTGVYKVYG